MPVHLKTLSPFTVTRKLLRQTKVSFHIGRRCMQTESPPWRILFFGTDKFSLHHLQMLQQHYSNKDTEQPLVQKLDIVVPHGKCDVGKFANKSGLKLYNWPLQMEQMESYDIGVLVSFGHLIPKKVISIFPKGIINVHPSLLPRYRGACPLHHTLLGGDKETGVSIMKIMPRKFDHGPILLQTKVSLPPEINFDELRSLMAKEGSQALLEVLKDFNSYLNQEKEQEEANAIIAPKFMPSHANINWEDTAEHIYRQYRAVGPQHHLRTEVNGMRVKLLDMIPYSQMKNLLPAIEESSYRDKITGPGYAYLLKPSKCLCIKCKDSWVAFNKAVTKKPLAAVDFCTGHLKSNKGIHSGILTSLKHGLEQFPHWNS